LEIELKNIILRRVSIFEFLHSQGQKRRFDRAPFTSGLPQQTDILRVPRQVSKVPTAEVQVYFVWGRAPDHQLLDKRKPDPERRAAVNLISCRYEPMVRFNNGARDGKPHAHAFRLAGEKRFEDLF
jgi:hypothetical protein